MALEGIEIRDAVQTVIVTSRKHWELRDVIPDANTTANPFDERGLSARGNLGMGPRNRLI